MTDTVLTVNLFPDIHSALLKCLKAEGVRVLSLDAGSPGNETSLLEGALNEKIIGEAAKKTIQAKQKIMFAANKCGENILRKVESRGNFQVDVEKIKERFSKALPAAVRTTHAFAEAFRCYKPKLLISGNEFTQESRIAFALARQQKVTSLHVEHGISAAYGPLESYSADVNAVWGKESLTRFSGNAAGRNVLVGNAAWDKYYRKQTYPNPYADLLPEGIRPILLAWTWINSGSSGNYWRSLSEPLRVLDDCLKMLEERPDLGLVVKLHPLHSHHGFAETGWFQKKIAASGVSGRVAVTTGNSEGLLQHCHCCLVYGSCFGIEAMINQAPIIDLHPQWHDSLFQSQHPVMRASNANELLDGLSRLDQPAARAEYISTLNNLSRDFNYDGDGKAGQRLGDLLISLLNHSFSDA